MKSISVVEVDRHPEPARLVGRIYAEELGEPATPPQYSALSSNPQRYISTSPTTSTSNPVSIFLALEGVLHLNPYDLCDGTIMGVIFAEDIESAAV